MNRGSNLRDYFIWDFVHPVIGASVFCALFKDFVFGLAAGHEVAIHADVATAYYFGHWVVLLPRHSIKPASP
jgi:hypothetical protein